MRQKTISGYRFLSMNSPILDEKKKAHSDLKAQIAALQKQKAALWKEISELSKKPRKSSVLDDLDVLKLLDEGETPKSIGHKFGISPPRVRAHIENRFHKSKAGLSPHGVRAVVWVKAVRDILFPGVWPLGLHPKVDTRLAHFNLAHWSCLSRPGYGYPSCWKRKDGLVVKTSTDSWYVDQLLKIDEDTPMPVLQPTPMRDWLRLAGFPYRSLTDSSWEYPDEKDISE